MRKRMTYPNTAAHRPHEGVSLRSNEELRISSPEIVAVGDTPDKVNV
jgi:hypothetical protein